MVEKRPHILRYTQLASDSVQDANGNWTVPATTQPENILNCRAEPNGGSQMISAEDGSEVRFGWTIYLDGDALRIPFGLKIQVFNGLDLILTNKVLRFSKDQKHCRIWV